jgi:EpsI family protein
MVDRWGGSMAEGFLHDFEGWAVFMASIGVLLLETRLLTLLSGDRRPWREVFSVEPPPRQTRSSARRASPVSVPLVASTAVLALFTLGVTLLPERTPVIPARSAFASFPTELSGPAGTWTGRLRPLEQVYVNALKLDDYVVADYQREGSPIPVNFYVAWYNSQATGESAHSPRSCIPGGGWLIVDLSQKQIDGVQLGGGPLRLNRVLIQNGVQRNLVYYWFQQRGRVITNEYLLKWFLLRDSIVRNRADGALVRLVAPIRAEGTEAETDRELAGFVGAVAPSLGAYIPD